MTSQFTQMADLLAHTARFIIAMVFAFQHLKDESRSEQQFRGRVIIMLALILLSQ